MLIRRKIRVILSLIITLSIIFTGMHFIAVSNTIVMGKSGLNSQPILDASNNYVLKTYMNTSFNSTTGRIYYFPSNLSSDRNISLALIPSGWHLNEVGSNLSKVLNLSGKHSNMFAFAAFFGIALVNGPSSVFSKIGVKISSVEVKSAANSYYGCLSYESQVGRGSTAFATTWYYGSAVRLVYILKNTTGNYLTYLPPGSYSLIVHLSVYSLHLIYKQPLGQIVLSMPWTIVSTNYSGNSFLAWANQP